MGYVLTTSPENSWNILSSSYNTDVSSFMDDEFLVPIISNQWRDESGQTGMSGYIEDKKINPERYSESCQSIFKAEAQRLGISEQSCDPIVKGMGADYLLVYIVGERFYTENTNAPLYTLEGGGDESKKAWFLKISNRQVSKYVQDDNITPTDYYMKTSTLGMLTPFSIFKYVEPNTGRTFDEYQSGLIPIYVNDLKLKDSEKDPFYLVYASPSFYSQDSGVMSAVLIYKINPDYNS